MEKLNFFIIRIAFNFSHWKNFIFLLFSGKQYLLEQIVNGFKLHSIYFNLIFFIGTLIIFIEFFYIKVQLKY
jgi:hypothetical protein